MVEDDKYRFIWKRLMGGGWWRHFRITFYKRFLGFSWGVLAKMPPPASTPEGNASTSLHQAGSYGMEGNSDD